MSDNKPALTEREWANLRADNANAPRDDFRSHTEGEVSIYGLSQWEAPDKIVVGVDYDSGACAQVIANRHAAAALCLHNQPFGFTREDVKTLRDYAESESLVWGEDEELASLAARIEALLPPEEK